ncbi:MAG: exodeoxyribonuclease III [Alphaproteobacteria bacterium]|nr:exodeoxyribonuclease III [Alphaproteobacteria bacterium]
MKIVTWNVNSIGMRLEHVLRFLREESPDILMMQELKTLTCPTTEFEALGYSSHALGQKAYNGVAILSKAPIILMQDRLSGEDADEQARYLEAEIKGLRIINIYAPNGNPLPSEKFDYKLRWLARLQMRLQHLIQGGVPFVIGGDFNIIPEAKDCHDPKTWMDDALYRIESRQKFRALLNLGLTDAFRIQNSNGGHYSFWDYQAGAWPRNHGIRIDHFLLSPLIADRMRSCRIEAAPRGWEKPSDHVPVIVELDF